MGHSQHQKKPQMAEHCLKSISPEGHGCENEGKIQSVSPQVLPESQASVVSLILVVHRN